MVRDDTIELVLSSNPEKWFRASDLIDITGQNEQKVWSCLRRLSRNNAVVRHHIGRAYLYRINNGEIASEPEGIGIVELTVKHFLKNNFDKWYLSSEIMERHPERSKRAIRSALDRLSRKNLVQRKMSTRKWGRNEYRWCQDAA
jgi:predicted transcriptional regulator